MVVPAEDLEDRTYAIAKTIVARSPASVKAAKAAIYALSEATAINPHTFEYLHGLRRSVYSGPTQRRSSGFP